MSQRKVEFSRSPGWIDPSSIDSFKNDSFALFSSLFNNSDSAGWYLDRGLCFVLISRFKALIVVLCEFLFLRCAPTVFVGFDCHSSPWFHCGWALFSDDASDFWSCFEFFKLLASQELVITIGDFSMNWLISCTVRDLWFIYECSEFVFVIVSNMLNMFV